MRASAELLNRMAVVVVVAAFVLVGWAVRERLVTDQRLAIRDITIEGDVDPSMLDALKESLGKGVKGTFFSVDMEEVRDIVESTPWVEHAAVRRIWPQKLSIGLMRYTMVGVWTDGRLVSDRGTLFTANVEAGDTSRAKLAGHAGEGDEGTFSDRYLEFGGDETRVAEMVGRKEAFAAEANRIGVQLAGIELSRRGAWTLTLLDREDGEIRVELGIEDADRPGETVERRFARVASGFGTACKALGGFPSRIDARYKNGFAAARDKKDEAPPPEGEQQQEGKP